MSERSVLAKPLSPLGEGKVGMLRKLALVLLIALSFAAHLSQASSAFYDYCPPAVCCAQDSGTHDHGGGDGPDCACHWVTATAPLESVFLPCLRLAVVVRISEEPVGELREAIKAIDLPPQLS